MTYEKTGAVVAAAGLSSRMAAFKPMLPLGKCSMAQRCIQNLQEAGASEIVVVTGFRARELEAHLKKFPVRFVYNPDYASSDMFYSLRLGMQAILGKCQRLLITPADVPLVEARTIQSLLDVKASLVRPVFHGKPGHPIALRAGWIPALLDYRGEDGLRGALRTLRIRPVDVPVGDENILLDVDTPEDYRRLAEKEEVYYEGIV